MEDTTVINNSLSIMNTNDTFNTNAVLAKSDDPLWVLFMDNSQLVMTLIGVIANTATFITLIKNKEVCERCSLLHEQNWSNFF